MIKIDKKYHNNLKSWPFKEAAQILKKNGGLQNFQIPKKGLFHYVPFSGPFEIRNFFSTPAQI